MNKYIVYASIVIIFFVGTAVGYAFTPEYASMRTEASSGMVQLGVADRYIDLRYMDGMIAHHLTAISLLKQAQIYSKRPEIQALAATVIQADEKGIETLYSWKKLWYGNTKQITKFQIIQLGVGDDKFDLRLLNALIAHHDEAIARGKEIQTKSTRTEILTLADSVITSLSENKTQLISWRKLWYEIE